MGKGSVRRPTNEKTYRENYDEIFKKKDDKPKQEESKEKDSHNDKT